MKYKENIFAPYFVADPPETEMPPPVEESHESGRVFIITIVILGIFILGAVVFVAVYIYRYVQL